MCANAAGSRVHNRPTPETDLPVFCIALSLALCPPANSQTLPSVPTPLPPYLAALEDAQLMEAASPAAARLWQWRTRGGLQSLAPRLDSAGAGWRVEKEDVDSANHLHWCVYVEGDGEVGWEQAPQEIWELEDELRRYVRELAGLLVMDTLLDSVVS